MPTGLREAHQRNDEVLERIYIGRRFRNDTERLEKLFELYTKMVAASSNDRPCFLMFAAFFAGSHPKRSIHAP
jgi:hypothetical protein